MPIWNLKFRFEPLATAESNIVPTPSPSRASPCCPACGEEIVRFRAGGPLDNSPDREIGDTTTDRLTEVRRTGTPAARSSRSSGPRISGGAANRDLTIAAIACRPSGPRVRHRVAPEFERATDNRSRGESSARLIEVKVTSQRPVESKKSPPIRPRIDGPIVLSSEPGEPRFVFNTYHNPRRGLLRLRRPFCLRPWACRRSGRRWLIARWRRWRRFAGRCG